MSCVQFTRAQDVFLFVGSWKSVCELPETVKLRQVLVEYYRSIPGLLHNGGLAPYTMDVNQLRRVTSMCIHGTTSARVTYSGGRYRRAGLAGGCRTVCWVKLYDCQAAENLI